MEKALTDKQIKDVYDFWCNGYTQEEIAAFYSVNVRTIRRYLQGKKKIKPPLKRK